MKTTDVILKGGGSAVVESDGRTVWLNTAVCLARFGFAGIDIHQSIELQMSKGECLYCTHEMTTPKDWDLFKEKVFEIYGVRIGDEHKPKRLQ